MQSNKFKKIINFLINKQKNAQSNDEIIKINKVIDELTCDIPQYYIIIDKLYKYLSDDDYKTITNICNEKDTIVITI